MNDVFVVPTHTGACDVAGLVKIADQPLCRALSDPNRLSNPSRGAGGIPGDVEEHSRLIRQK